jgi:hypothetical protein
VILSALILRSSDPSGLLLWCVVGFCAGIGLFIYGFRLLQRRRLILDTPLSKIRSASMGMVEVSGLAVGPYTMVAPITARPCYYYRTLVWEWKQDGRDKTWVKIAAECMHLPFFVDDNTGHLLIDPRGADLDLHRDFEQEFSDSFFSSKDPVPDTVRSFLARHGIGANNKLKVEEFCIKPKNSLFILGTLAENPGIDVTPQPTRDEEPITSISSHGFSFSLNSISHSSHRNDDHFNIGSLAERLGVQSDVRHEVVHLSPDTGSTKTTDMTQQQKIAAALLKAGISNPAAWSAAGVPTASNALPVIVLTETASAKSNTSASNVSSSDQANGFVLHPPVVLRKGTNNKTFLISWRSQNQLARSLGWKCTLMIWGGPALAILSLYFFLGSKNLF